MQNIICLRSQHSSRTFIMILNFSYFDLSRLLCFALPSSLSSFPSFLSVVLLLLTKFTVCGVHKAFNNRCSWSNSVPTLLSSQKCFHFSHWCVVPVRCSGYHSCANGLSRIIFASSFCSWIWEVCSMHRTRRLLVLLSPFLYLLWLSVLCTLSFIGPLHLW